jgi:pyruvate dehydrogenase E1 component alpha subunit
MRLEKSTDLIIYEKAALCRAFEEEVFRNLQNKNIKIPVYLSAGQEYIAATFATFFEKYFAKINKQIFIQHRGHATYISFGGALKKLALELLGSKDGCANGMGGSASIQCKEKNIYGHDGLMGSHGPIAVGACFGNNFPTLCFIGDAAAEEDYFLASLGWASTKKLPIWFIVEDNNLSILTEKKVRRNWEMHDVAKSFGLESFDVEDDPKEIWNCFSKDLIYKPCLFNVRTNRLFWHAGAGIDDPNTFDRQKQYISKYGRTILNEADVEAKKVWKKCLKLV